MLRYIILCASVCMCFANPSTRIVNGTDATSGEIPYIVSLRYNQRHTCGASILSPFFLLTASHCVYGRNTGSFSIQYGVLKITPDDTNSIRVATVKTHENYIPGNGYINDVAVLMLVSAIPFSDRVRSVILPTPNQETLGWTDAILAGWGLPYTDGQAMENLQRVNIYIYPDDECEAAHGGVARKEYHVCGGVPEGGMGQCSGDSGGPLCVNDVVFGIVSWSVKPCTLRGYPGVFTRVASYVDWIIQNSQK